MPATPEALTDHSASGVLEVRWSDGTVHELPHALLRSRCRCAACEQQRRSGATIAVAEGIRLTAIHPISNQGLNLVFSDGHGRGIYPWAYLLALGAELAPLPEA
jgi:DUF971 family protein